MYWFNHTYWCYNTIVINILTFILVWPAQFIFYWTDFLQSPYHLLLKSAIPLFFEKLFNLMNCIFLSSKNDHEEWKIPLEAKYYPFKKAEKGVWNTFFVQCVNQPAADDFFKTVHIIHTDKHTYKHTHTLSVTSYTMIMPCAPL